MSEWVMLSHFLKSKKSLKVALLATGDELTYGDIVNTNSQQIAKLLTEQNIPVGLHIISSDDKLDIKNTILFLLKSHTSIIITGGLGPTSDDRTRFALSIAIKKSLVFDNNSWQHIVARIQTRYPGRALPESNRQQAWFPKGAIIFNNPHGTANGCGLKLKNKWIFMLPGPPHECLTMLQTYVLPQLIQADYPQEIYRKKWMLMNVSEGQIAEELDRLVAQHGVLTGYRIAKPYLEFKIQCQNKLNFERAVQQIESYTKSFQVENPV